MTATELMIGDWVFNTHNRKPEQVAQIGIGSVMLDYNDLYEYDLIEPIPLTSEILEKNGFGYTESDGHIKHFFLGERHFCKDMKLHIGTDLDKRNGVFWLNYFGNSLWRIEYVHELQHAFRLFHITKEIEHELSLI